MRKEYTRLPTYPCPCAASTCCCACSAHATRGHLLQSDIPKPALFCLQTPPPATPAANLPPVIPSPLPTLRSVRGGDPNGEELHAPFLRLRLLHSLFLAVQAAAVGRSSVRGWRLPQDARRAVLCCAALCMLGLCAGGSSAAGGQPCRGAPPGAPGAASLAALRCACLQRVEACLRVRTGQPTRLPLAANSSLSSPPLPSLFPSLLTSLCLLLSPTCCLLAPDSHPSLLL